MRKALYVLDGAAFDRIYGQEERAVIARLVDVYAPLQTSAAVAATRGMVLMRRDGGLVDTVYSASCGGHTEHNDHAWPVKPDPNLRGHLDGPQSGRQDQRGLTTRVGFRLPEPKPSEGGPGGEGDRDAFHRSPGGVRDAGNETDAPGGVERTGQTDLRRLPGLPRGRGDQHQQREKRDATAQAHEPSPRRPAHARVPLPASPRWR